MNNICKVFKIIKKLFDSKLFLLFLALICSYIWAEQCDITFFNRGYSTIDSSVFRYVAYAMTKGQVPYKDIFDHKGPLIYLINYLGYLIHPKVGVWFFEFITIFVTVVFSYKCAKLASDNSIFSCISVIISFSLLYIYLCGGNFVEEYAMPFISMATYIFGRYFKEHQAKPLQLIVCGMCGGCVLMLRPNMAVIWLVFPIFVVINELVHKNYIKILRYFIWFFIGVMISILPFIIYLTLKDALVDFWNVYIKFNLQYTNNSSFKDFVETVYCFLSPVILLSFLLLLFNIFLLNNNKLFNIAYFISLILSLLFLSISGRTYEHYAMIIVPVCAYPIASLFIHYKNEWFSHIVTTSLTIIYLFSYWLFPSYACLKNVLIGVHTSSDEVVDSVVEYIYENTTESDEILVVGNDNRIYLHSGRLSSSKYSYQYPIAYISEDIYNDFYNEISIDNPKLIIFNESFIGIEEFLNEYNYSCVYTKDDYEIYKQIDCDYKLTSSVEPIFTKYTDNPILGDEDTGSIFDAYVSKKDNIYRMDYSWRKEKALAVSFSEDGFNWSEPYITLSSNDGSGWEDDVNRNCVLEIDGKYKMWYTGQSNGFSYIGYAESNDGLNFERCFEKPILNPQFDWEGKSVTNPCVLYEEGVYKMYYAAGETYEPNVIGYAESLDGIEWVKKDKPVLEAYKNNEWEKDRVGGVQVIKTDTNYLMFYIGYENIDIANICLAYSIDGIEWVRYDNNLVIKPDVNSWDGDACYKPTVVWDEDNNRWMLWYNGRNEDCEYIGLAYKEGKYFD